MPLQSSSNIFGPFQTPKFAQGTVIEFNVNAGWKDASTYLNMTIVNDSANGDDFLFQDGVEKYDGGQFIGQPFQFTYGGFTFAGLLKSSEQINNFGGNPTYTVILQSPIDVLDACQVVLSAYVGPNNDSIFAGSPNKNPSFEVSNLINVYGWAENGGASFGRSQETSIGLPWGNGKDYGIQAALTAITNSPPAGPVSNNFGSHIIYKGNYYSLDLSNFPIPPSYYRLGGVVNMTLRELIVKFLEDSGNDWLINLTVNPNNSQGPHTIGFTLVPRYVQQPLGKILQYITGQDQNVIAQKSHGEELRSDITQAFLVGGSLNLLQPVQNNGMNLNVLPFWGFDFNGNPIVGQRPDGTQTADDNLAMNLNATQVADIMGQLGYGLAYPCSILELRCALGNFDTWAAYIQLYKPAMAQALNLYGAWDSVNAVSANQVVDLINDDPNFVQQLGLIFTNNFWPAFAQRLYEYVRNQAETYYGKKFIVLLPFDIQIKIDTQTGEVTLNNEIADAGYLPEGSAPLGLSITNENFFLDQTGRFYPFVSFLYTSVFNSVAGQKTVTPNVAYLKSSSCVAQYNQNPAYSYLFSRCEQGEDAPVYQDGLIGGGSQIFFMPNGGGLGFPVPAMVVTAPDAIWAQADDITGSVTDLAAMLQMPLSTLQNIIATRGSSFSPVIHPPAFYPNGCAVALKSNQALYGPWGRFAADGKLEFEQDDGLVPWEYGGYELMTQAAIAKLNNIAMGNQVLERGEFVEAGIPQFSLGQQLVTEGPILTSIDCKVSVSQVTTTYTMETFVNRVGVFTIENAEILRRIGKVYQQLRRTMRQTILTNIDRVNTMLENYNGFMYGTSYAIEQHTPHACLGGRLVINNSGGYTPNAWTQTYQESLANLGYGNTQIFQSTACAGMEVLLRPFTMDINNNYLPLYVPADETYTSSNLITSNTGLSLNPLQQGCDTSWLLYGDNYQSMRTGKGMTDYTTVRSLALAGPLVLCSWGYDIQGNPVPNSGAYNTIVTDSGNINYIDWSTPLQTYNYNFIENYLNKSIDWPVGPVDIAWDKFRGVWASRGMILSGIASGTIPANSQPGNMQLWIDNQLSQETVVIKNFFSSSVPNGTKVQAGYDPLNNCLRLVGADCPLS